MNDTTSEHPTPTVCLLFARHGATAPNLAGLRCGGDLDPPLTDTGRRQAIELARVVAAQAQPIEWIITSDLQRTRETAAIVRAAVGPVEVLVLPGFRERRLGQWNLAPISETEGRLSAGETPPGGESGQAFRARIEQALRDIAPQLKRRALLVGSKGVGRVLRECAGQPSRTPLANAELLELHFEWARLAEPMVNAA